MASTYIISRGRVIRECERVKGAHAGAWIIQTYHAGTGLPWDDRECPHFRTIAEAKEYIRGESRE